MSPWKAYLEDILFSFRKHKELAETAFRQVEDEGFFCKPGEHSNSIAAVIKHVAGNLASRWTDFLTTDGDKPWRDRDAEFIIGPEDARPSLLAAWERGWTALFNTLGNLQEDDLPKMVTIRREEHTVRARFPPTNSRKSVTSPLSGAKSLLDAPSGTNSALWRPTERFRFRPARPNCCVLVTNLRFPDNLGRPT